jgi:proton-translocating NADH-quinone oxidoreductase chain N
MPITQYLSLFLPQIAVLLTAVAALVAAMLRRPRIAFLAALAGSMAAPILAIRLLGTQQHIFEGTFMVSSLSLWAGIILPLATAACLLLFRDEMRGDIREAPAYSLFMFGTLGVMLLSGAGSMMLVVTGSLMSALATFGLVGLRQTNLATEAAMKYFVYASVSTAVMIFGMSYWYGVTGSTQLADLGRLVAVPLAGVVGLIGVLVGVGYKAAIVPVQTWAPDTYQGSPISVAAYLSVVTKIGGIFGLAQIVTYLPDNIHWRLLFAIAAVATMLYGTLIALSQKHLVRLLAYSSIAQSGYFLLALVAIGHSNQAIPALIVFAAAYAAMNIGAFSIIRVVGPDIVSYGGLARRRPLLAAGMVTFLLSLTGIPPLFGFVGKLLLLAAAIAGGYLWLSIIAILVSVLSLAVYLRIIGPMYRDRNADEQVASEMTHTLLTPLVTAICLIATVGLGLTAQLIIGTL